MGNRGGENVNRGTWIAIAGGVAVVLIAALEIRFGVFAQMRGGFWPPFPIVGCDVRCEVEIALQRGVAASSAAMAIASIASVLVVAISAYFVLLNLGAAREMNRQAAATLEQAAVATQANLEMSRAQTRAYIVFTFATAAYEGGDRMTIRFGYRNSGQTPASRIYTNVLGAIFDPEAADFEREKQELTLAKSRSDVPAGEERTARFDIQLSPAMVAAINEPDAAQVFAIEAQVMYFDVFGEDHEARKQYAAHADWRWFDNGKHTLFAV